MTIKNLSRMAAMAAVVVAGFASCTSDDEADNTVVGGTQTAIEQACSDWKTARKNWEQSEAFLFGAADEYSIDPHTDTWPVDAKALASVLRDEKAMGDIDKFMKTANSSIMGYHGIEYVLFRNGLPREVSQITELEYKYVCAVAKDLYNATATLESTWDPAESNVVRKQIAQDYIASHFSLDDDGNATKEELAYANFGKQFLNPGAGSSWSSALEATLEIISGCQDIVGEVGDSKIGLPFSGEDASYIESPYAYNSIIDFYDNIVSCKNALYGEMGAAAPTTNSVIYFCQHSSATLASQADNTVAKLDNALGKINAMKAPFVKFYTDSSCKQAMDALSELSDALDELSTTLGGYAGNPTVEAQCQEINKSYINNVVVPTYRTLADNASKLYISIQKLNEK